MIYLLLIVLTVVVVLQTRRHFLDGKRLEVLKKLNIQSNPRFGVNHRIAFSLEQLREFFDADTGMLILQEKDGNAYAMHQVNRTDTCLKDEETPLAPRLAHVLMSIPSNSTAIYSAPSLYRNREKVRCYDVKTGEDVPFEKEVLQKVGAFMGHHFLTVPLVRHHKTVGRIFIASRVQSFSRGDVDFIFHVANQIIGNIKNLETVNRLAEDAAEEERRRIARDIHDSIVQPYIGLQMAIETMRQKVVAGDKGLLHDVERLDQMCLEGTQELRGYIQQLRDGRSGESSLLPAVQRFASKFMTATGIEVQVESSPNFSVHEDLAAHVFQMTVEGLSNVHRHTQAESASIRLGCDKERLLLQIENSGAEPKGQVHPPSSRPKTRVAFTPRSISERANSLGGTVHVETHPDGRAVVSIDIPL